MASRRRDQILENCRWLFGQEVQIVTFALRSYLKQAPNSTTRGPNELHYYAAVLPKSCLLTSLASRDLEEKILLKESHLLSSDGATSKLLETVEEKIGMMLETDGGRIQIRLVGEEGEEKVDETQVIQHATSEPLPLPAATGTAQPGEVDTPIAFPDSIVPEQTKSFFEALLKKPAAKSIRAGPTAGAVSQTKYPEPKPESNTRGAFLRSIEQAHTEMYTDEHNHLTEHNLALLVSKHKNVKPRPPRKWRLQPQRNPYSRDPTPSLASSPKPQGNPYPHDDPAPSLASSPNLPDKDTSLELTRRVTELEDKLLALDAVVKTLHAELYHFASPVMTPTTSVASTVVSRRGSVVDAPGIKLALETQSEVSVSPVSVGGLGARAFLFA